MVLVRAKDFLQECVVLSAGALAPFAARPAALAGCPVQKPDPWVLAAAAPRVVDCAGHPASAVRIGWACAGAVSAAARVVAALGV